MLGSKLFSTFALEVFPPETLPVPDSGIIPEDSNRLLYNLLISSPYVRLGAHFPPNAFTVTTVPFIVTKCLGSYVLLLG
ncbi:MAG: hypothetical protein Q607_CBUC00032G0010 [Clostridium butyricum DORA_1]|nr:MAG: hypothetical protein Q607_CBUC00032G0010 [Clostridium butyricum DORA_1]